MNLIIYDQSGVQVFCGCGKPATGWRLNTLSQPQYHCIDCDPAGQPCPLCGGTGKLPRQ